MQTKGENLLISYFEKETKRKLIEIFFFSKEAPNIYRTAAPWRPISILIKASYFLGVTWYLKIGLDLLKYRCIIVTCCTLSVG